MNKYNTNKISPKNFKGKSKQQLLKLKISQLNLTIKGSILEQAKKALYEDLKNAGFKLFFPDIYLADEWFSPEGLPIIAVPFYLTSNKLISIEKDMIGYAEGDEFEWCMKLLRHEAGHCLDHLYNLSETKEWQLQFGSPLKKYDPSKYKPEIYSSKYVKNLEDCYGQSHPDEDFAETFAVWLNPNSKWKKLYKDKIIPLGKLEYLNAKIKAIQSNEKKIPKCSKDYNVNDLHMSLNSHYNKKIKSLGEDHESWFDQQLEKIFNSPSDSNKKNSSKACKWIKYESRNLINETSNQTGEYKYITKTLISRLEKRTRKINLNMSKNPLETKDKMSKFLKLAVTNYGKKGLFTYWQ